MSNLEHAKRACLQLSCAQMLRCLQGFEDRASASAGARRLPPAQLTAQCDEGLSDARKQVRASACCMPVTQSIPPSAVAAADASAPLPCWHGPSQKRPASHPVAASLSVDCSFRPSAGLCWHADARWAPQQTPQAARPVCLCCWVGRRVRATAVLHVAPDAVLCSRHLHSCDRSLPRMYEVADR